MLSLVAEAVSAIILPAAKDVLECVDYMCGRPPLQCTCCECQGSEEEEEEEDEDQPGGPCRGDRPSGPDRQPPAATLSVPNPAAFDIPEPSKPWKKARGGTAGHSSSEEAGSGLAAAAQPKAAEGVPAPASPVAGGRLPSKALLATLSPADVAAPRHPLWLRFQHPALEAEFTQWQGLQLAKVDILFSLTMIAAMGVVGWMQPYCLSVRSPGGLLLGAGCLLPLIMATFFEETYIGGTRGGGVGWGFGAQCSYVPCPPAVGGVQAAWVGGKARLLPSPVVSPAPPAARLRARAPSFPFLPRLARHAPADPPTCPLAARAGPGPCLHCSPPRVVCLPHAHLPGGLH